MTDAEREEQIELRGQAGVTFANVQSYMEVAYEATSKEIQDAMLANDGLIVEGLRVGSKVYYVGDKVGAAANLIEWTAPDDADDDN